jgi:hypothetical protein
MAKHDVHRNPKLPSREDTKKYQNFDSIINDFESVHRPWWMLQNILRKPKLVRILVLAVIVILTLFLTHQHYNHDSASDSDDPSTTEEYTPSSE